MKQCDWQEYLKNPNRKIITRDGKSTRIICTNRLDENYPVIALVNDEYTEKCYSYSEFGKFENRDCELDLFFAPQKKEGWVNIYKYNSKITIGSLVYDTKEEAESAAGNKSDYISTTKIQREE